MRSSKRWPDAPALYDDPVAKAASEAGGVLIGVRLSLRLGPNGGCGAPTYVVGTNGGTLPCGSLLTQFGQTAPYYCGLCSPNVVLSGEKQPPEEA